MQLYTQTFHWYTLFLYSIFCITFCFFFIFPVLPSVLHTYILLSPVCPCLCPYWPHLLFPSFSPYFLPSKLISFPLQLILKQKGKKALHKEYFYLRCLSTIYWQHLLVSNLVFSSVALIWYFSSSSTVYMIGKTSFPTQQATRCVTQKNLRSDLEAGKQAPLLHHWNQTATGVESTAKRACVGSTTVCRTVTHVWTLFWYQLLLQLHCILLVIRKSGAQKKVWDNTWQKRETERKVKGWESESVVHSTDREVITLCSSSISFPPFGGFPVYYLLSADKSVKCRLDGARKGKQYSWTFSWKSPCRNNLSSHGLSRFFTVMSLLFFPLHVCVFSHSYPAVLNISASLSSRF